MVERAPSPAESSEVVSPEVPLYPRIEFPEDSAVSDLPNLFSADRVWEMYCRAFGAPDAVPKRIRLRHYSHTPGRSAGANYALEWDADEFLPTQQFAIRIGQERSIEIFRWPDDPYLPGLAQAARPDTALRLLNTYVLPVSARRVRVDLIRYRPADRGVLRHSVGRLGFFARVTRSTAVERVLAAHELIEQSGFLIPRLAGHWAGGGCVWFSEVPGRNLREEIRLGNAPDASLLLDGLATLWATPATGQNLQPFNLAGAYARAKKSFRHYARNFCGATQALDDASRMLDPFITRWQPTAIAHNDFYDDQMLVLADRRVAVVDFEEAGPGDPLLDVGNFLAHLLWAQRFGREGQKESVGAYYQAIRQTALERFGWNARELAYREATSLFRICTNTIRRPREDWAERLEAGLRLVNETIGREL